MTGFYGPEPYHLVTKIRKINTNEFELIAEFHYEFENVWKARNAYEKFFSNNYDYDTDDFIKPIFKRKIKIDGDEHKINYCEICVWSTLSFEDAKLIESDLKAQEELIKKHHISLEEMDCDEEFQINPFD